MTEKKAYQQDPKVADILLRMYDKAMKGKHRGVFGCVFGTDDYDDYSTTAFYKTPDISTAELLGHIEMLKYDILRGTNRKEDDEPIG